MSTFDTILTSRAGRPLEVQFKPPGAGQQKFRLGDTIPGIFATGVGYMALPGIVVDEREELLYYEVTIVDNVVKDCCEISLDEYEQLD
jgi:hypothetical protein